MSADEGTSGDPGAEMLRVSSRIGIPLNEFSFSFMRSSGPGGQNVNKVNTKARLRWPVLDSPSLPPAVRERFIQRFRSRLTTEGELIITSQRYRDQKRNVADCLDRLRVMLLEVAQPPRRRKVTKPTRASRQRRLTEKRHKSERKALRRPPKAGE